MRLFFLLAVLLVTAPSFANDFEEGLDAIHGTDYDKALAKLRPLASEGHAAAQYNLGVMHEWGDGVPQNNLLAIKWYRRAAENFHKDAQNSLGAMYSKGEGVEENFIKALKWFVIAGENGSEEGRKNIDMVEKRMTSEQITLARKLAREWMRQHFKK